MSIPLHAYSCEECNSTARSTSPALYIDHSQLTKTRINVFGTSSAGVLSANPPRQLALATIAPEPFFVKHNFITDPADRPGNIATGSTHCGIIRSHGQIWIIRSICRYCRTMCRRRLPYRSLYSNRPKAEATNQKEASSDGLTDGAHKLDG